MTTPSESLARLREVAEKAEPGPWKWTYGYQSAGDEVEDYASHLEGAGNTILIIDPGEYWLSEGNYTAKHIEQFDPPTVLALLDAIEAVLRLHKQQMWRCGFDLAEYPCPTIAIITKALEGLGS